MGERPDISESGHSRRAFLGTSLAAALTVGLAACGDSGDDSSGTTTAAAGSTDAGTPSAAETAAGASTSAAPSSSAAATSSPATSAAEATIKRGGRLRVGHVGGGTAETLHPHNMVAFLDAARAQNLYDGLTAFGPTNELELRLAESMEPNATGDVWQVKLRQGVTFHDGKPLTADDVLYTWQYMLSGDHQDNLAATLAGLIDIAATKKVDDTTIEVHLEAPTGYLPEAMALPWAQGIFPDGSTEEQLNTKPNGTGPFKFVSWTPGQRSLFARNENYWSGDGPYVDELEMISLPDQTARLNALLGGQVDAIESPAFSQIKAQEGNSAITLVQTKGTGWTGFFMRLNQKPFTDPLVVEAFKLALDRPKTIDIAQLGFAALGNDVYGAGFSSFVPPATQHAYDPEKAKALLAQAGYSDGLDIPLYTSQLGPGTVESAQAYTQQAKDAGINVKLTNLPADQYYNTDLYYLKQPFYQTYWNSGSFEAITRLAMLKSSPGNETAWDRPDFEAAFAKASAVLDPAERATAMAPLQEMVWKEGGYILWSFVDSADLVSSKLQGVVPSPNAPLGNYDFRSVWLDA